MNTQQSKQTKKEKDDDFDFFKTHTTQKDAVEPQDKKNRIKFFAPMAVGLIIVGSILISISIPITPKVIPPVPASKSLVTPIPSTTPKAPIVDTQIEPPTLEQEKQLDETIKGLKDIGQQLKQTQMESNKAATAIKKKLEGQNKN